MKPTVLLSMMRWRGAAAVARALLDAADVNLVAAAPCTFELEAEGIPHCDYFSEFMPKDPAASLMPCMLERLSRAMDVVQSDGFRASYPSIGDGAWQRLQETLAKGLREHFVSAALHSEALRHCAAETDLRLLVLSEDNIHLTRTMALTANRLGIPSLHIPHGATGGAATLHPGMSATFIAAHSHHMRQQYERCGAAADRIVVTGNPAWDWLCRPVDPDRRARIRREAGLDPDKPFINYAMTDSRVFASSCLRPAFANHHTKYVEAVLDAYAALAPRYPDWQFAIRPRPGDDTDPPLEALLERYASRGLRGVLIDRQEPHDSLAIADLFLATQSNMGIEAMLMGMPHIDVNIAAFEMSMFNDEGLGPLLDQERDAVLTAREPDQIAAAIESAMTDADTRERLSAARPFSIDRYNYRGDGRAAERIRDLILSLMDTGHAAVPPIARYAAFESSLVAAVPQRANTVAVSGPASSPVRDALTAVRPDIGLTDSGLVDAVVISAPLSPTPDAHVVLVEAAALAGDDGVVIVPVRNRRWRLDEALFPGTKAAPPRPGFEPASGIDGYTLPGMRILLSRMGMALVEAQPVTESDVVDGEPPGWVVTARRRKADRATDETAIRQRERAEGCNRRGEKRFGNGDYAGAVREFSEAASLGPTQAVYHNNLAAALHAAGRHAQAWDALLDALHADPTDENARANLEAVGETLGRTDEAKRLLGLYGDTRNGA